MSQSDKVRIGAGFAWFRPSLNSVGRVTLASRYSGGTSPDLIFDETDFCWSTTGIFLGQTQGIDIALGYQDQKVNQDFINTATDSYLEDYNIVITMRLAYNGLTTISDLFETPEIANSNGVYLGGLGLDPYQGSLLILESNVRNNDVRYNHLVRARLYYNCVVKPTQLSFNNGHTFIEAKFEVEASIDPNTGCYRSYTYQRWTTSKYYPNTVYMPNGDPVNTDVDIPYPFAGGILMNL